MTELNNTAVNKLKLWFFDYVDTFKNGDTDLLQNITLKEKHTIEVCKNILNIGNQLKLNNNELNFANIIALFHDVARFKQYAHYKTFADSKSENHAELGVKILKEKKILSPFDESIQSLILRTILYHNRFSLPEDETKKCIFFSKLLRDADKLDIFRVVTNYYLNNNIEKNKAIELDLPNTKGFSEKVYQDIINYRLVDINHLTNLNDFKLLQIGWIFDINFKPTFHLIKKHNYLEMIFQVLPKSEKTEKINNIIQNYINEKLN